MSQAEPLFDRPILAQAYHDLRAQNGRPNDVLETPALKSVLPHLQGCDVLDLGCGAGGMAQWAIGEGAQSVRGVDASEQMISTARWACPSAIFEVGGIEDVAPADESLDVVMSGLALHYVHDFDSLVRNVSRGLRPGGMLAFSVEHPVMTCADRRWQERTSGERLHWPVDRYFVEGPWTVDCLASKSRGATGQSRPTSTPSSTRAWQ